MPQLDEIHVEALLEAGYMVMLVAVALGLEHMARIAHRRSERVETAGFQYHAALDTWECPTGKHLLLVLWQVIAAMEAGTVLGSSLLYWLARRGGRSVIERYGPFIGIGPVQLNRAGVRKVVECWV